MLSPTTARREMMRVRVLETCHHRKTRQRSCVFQVNSLGDFVSDFDPAAAQAGEMGGDS
jgi:hypothetical protein